ncbi:MAG: tRNA guanosine(34) transglycosylase Tgt [bacterium]|nr:tRNA guanosine(34) transglycosylase Tgt [bacterium]
MEFNIIKKSKKSRARLGLLNTDHGVVETPALVTVATQASIKTLTSEEAESVGSQLLIANTFHLHLRPGENIVKNAGGIHKFMNWNRPLMTDSGGFQVFSLGFGSDLNIGKSVKKNSNLIAMPAHAGRVGQSKEVIKEGSNPKNVKITDDGVYFSSPIDGRKLFIGPKESVRIQESLGADIIFSFDECPPPLASKAYIAQSLNKTNRWAEICIKTKKSKQALFGIVQGSRFKDLREQSAKYTNSLGFDGFGIGGDFGKDKKETSDIILWSTKYLDPKKPRHMLGIGHPEDIENVIKNGIDTFDCTVPTHYARRGIAFLDDKGKRLDLRKSKFLKDQKPLDPKCSCNVCRSYRRSYLCHLIKANEITGMHLLTLHNLYFFNSYIAGIREKIKRGTI